MSTGKPSKPSDLPRGSPYPFSQFSSTPALPPIGGRQVGRKLSPKVEGGKGGEGKVMGKETRWGAAGIIQRKRRVPNQNDDDIKLSIKQSGSEPSLRPHQRIFASSFFPHSPSVPPSVSSPSFSHSPSVPPSVSTPKPSVLFTPQFGINARPNFPAPSPSSSPSLSPCSSPPASGFANIPAPLPSSTPPPRNPSPSPPRLPSPSPSPYPSLSPSPPPSSPPSSSPSPSPSLSLSPSLSSSEDNFGTFVMTGNSEDESEMYGTFVMPSEQNSAATAMVHRFLEAESQDGPAKYREPEIWEKNLVSLNKGEWGDDMQESAFHRYKKTRRNLGEIFDPRQID